MVYFGFGFDPIDNDYKVVVLLTCFGKPWTAEVYSANTNVWSRVEPNPKDLPSYDDFDVCVNGFLCCVGTYGDRKRNEAEEKSKRPGKRCDQLATAKEIVRRLGMGTNTYTSAALLGQKKGGQFSKFCKSFSIAACILGNSRKF
ncbi:hypothetical protein POM88_008915 [Heracleum sosnowskyi]|uniref:Uncharacterized protein n=1 Tax=Heracleum sosnowskyi TaxID=360622 RepID=A0AAD8J7C4_9APIA|nr:hypothetical protein POM88_008915 [Heracleum sosnowskyi]